MSGPRFAAYDDPAARSVQDRLFRALAFLRVVLLANTVGLNVLRRDNFEHPTAALLVVLGLAAWTGFAIWAYREWESRKPPLLVADLVVAVLGLVVTPWLKGPDFNATVAGFWVMGAMFAWAIRWRVLGGFVAAATLCTVDLAIRQTFTQSNYGNLFLLMIGGPIIGYVCESLQRSAVALNSAERLAATEAERARLARAVHDGVLQVLALVQRRGGEIGGDAAELGRLAGEQEQRLRSLIRAQDSLRPPGFADGDGRVDLAVELARFEEHGFTTVSLPGTQVLLPAHTVDELVAAVSACLDNVLLHVGRSARAWVLLEAFPDRVVVSVRDEGPGIPAGRLESAQGEGRLGVVDSIRGRITDLGGTAELSTGSYGTEWELTVPRV
ncbi:MacS family sensor histidine kinase [Nocardioides agariphilus]|uniref:MacS family sensor histidine kinase n=1 Tax=Nocardioides agariphilus TaxID=433664 RepID=UPI0035213EF1